MADQSRWYELFSRGERDWLRHNQKVRQAVLAYVPQFLECPDLISGDPRRPVRVPLHLLEHARFRLADAPDGGSGAGHGPGRPGDMLRAGREPACAGSAESLAGDDGVRMQLEFTAGDITDWLWEELELPLLAPETGPGKEPANMRSGWNRQGALSQLDRRRTAMQAVKRRAAQTTRPSPAPGLAYINDDLRFRQQQPRRHAASKAVVLFALDVSASMTLPERKLAKTFFHFTLHGLRRRYQDVAVRFLAHATRAWEFSEQEFFQISGEGGTQASCLFQLAHDILRADYGGGHHNAYLFYASDGENYREDRAAASTALAALAPSLNFMGYAETVVGASRANAAQGSELQRLFAARQHAGDAAAICTLAQPDDAWNAIRSFFGHGAARK
ncbi:DUF444 family protein [Pseudoduganella aquatica]|uniref:DUF444 family protein n=1 Tax=Pseudoduganella aquatica TaxID=2660641 RepID=A0A7X4HE73_9BURK|nr:DUF444 family protein [Pseudoduganella aquatica]MYN08555.1 DUF444 family protein [Pseudoduganella aquatica]